MRKVRGKMVPENLTNEHSNNLKDVSLDLLDRVKGSQNSSVTLSQGANRGILNKILEHNSKDRSRTLQIVPVPGK